MFSAFALAIEQLAERRIRRVIVRSLMLTIALYVGLCAVVWGALFGTPLLSHLGWWGKGIEWFGGLAIPVVALILLPALMASMIGLFLDEVVDAVEERNYPGLPAPRRIPLLEAVLGSLRLSAMVIGLNLLILPLFLIPVVGQIAYYAINGYLIGREYFSLVALRRAEPLVVAGQFSGALGALWVAGVIITVLSTIPVVNLIAPVIGVAAMVHMARRLALRTRA